MPILHTYAILNTHHAGNYGNIGRAVFYHYLQVISIRYIIFYNIRK